MAGVDPAFVQEIEAHELRRNWPILGAFAASAIGGGVAYASGAWWGMIFAFWGTVMLPFGLWKNAFPRKLARALRASPAGLEIEPGRRWSREQIEQAWIEPGPSFALVRVRSTRGESIRLLLPAIAPAMQLLDALSLRPEQRAAAFAGLSAPRMRWPSVPLLSLIVTALGLFLATGLLIFAAPMSLLLFVLWRIPSRHVVGADGVRTSWLGLARFYPFAEVRAAAVEHGSPVRVRLELASGQIVRLAVGGDADAEAIRGSADVAFASRVALAHEAYLRRARLDPVPLLAREGRAAIDWVRALRRLLADRGEAYRDSGLSPELLSRVTHDPSADEVTRAAAAVALAAEGPDARADVRDAAAKCASPRLRASLERVVAAEDEAAVAEELEAMERAGR